LIPEESDSSCSATEESAGYYTLKTSSKCETTTLGQFQNYGDSCNKKHWTIAERRDFIVSFVEKLSRLQIVQAMLVEPTQSYHTASSQTEPQSLTVPLTFTGSGYVVSYQVDFETFHAILDTGSPFLMVPAGCSESCNHISSPIKTGCYQEERCQKGEPSGLSDTFELFDGFQGKVTWRRAPFSFVNSTGTLSIGKLSLQSPNHGARTFGKEIVFGVVDDDIMKGPGGGIFLGLIKETASWIRPSFLSQTDVTSIIINLTSRNKLLKNERKNCTGDGLTPCHDANSFIGPSLTLSNSPYLRNLDYIPITNDLRKVGDPVQHYVAKVSAIYINGQPFIPLDKKIIYAIFDTGVTGMLMSLELFNQRYTEARNRKDSKPWGGDIDIVFDTWKNYTSL
jgi:hypothetical protein